MTIDNTDQQDLELLAYLNDELGAAERVALEARIERDPALAEALARWQATFGDLTSDGVQPIEPSAEVIASTLEAVAKRAAEASGRPTPNRPISEMPQSPALSNPAASKTAMWLAAAAALLAMFGLVRQFQAENRLENRVQEIAAERDGLIEELANLGNRLRGTEGDIEQLALVLRAEAAPNATTVVLAGLEDAPRALGTAVIRPGEAAFFAYSLPGLAEDQDYQLWFIGQDGPISAGTFAIDSSGNARVTVAAENLEQATQWAVTIEVAGGVPQPTGPMVLLGSTSSA